MNPEMYIKRGNFTAVELLKKKKEKEELILGLSIIERWLNLNMNFVDCFIMKLTKLRGTNKIVDFLI